MTSTIEGRVAQASAEKATVTIVLVNGAIMTGTVGLHPTLPGAYRLTYLGQGTTTFYSDDVQEVIFE